MTDKRHDKPHDKRHDKPAPEQLEQEPAQLEEVPVDPPAPIPAGQTAPLRFAPLLPVDGLAAMRALIAAMELQAGAGIILPAGLLAALQARFPALYVPPPARPGLTSGPGNQGSSAYHIQGHAGTTADKAGSVRSLRFGTGGPS